MELYESWINRAISSYSLSRAAVNDDVYYEDLCYQAQQAAEKALKGLLIYFGVEPEFTHNIGVLLNELEKHTEIPDNVKNAMKLTNYAVQTRYPGAYENITKAEHEEAVEIAKDCLDWVTAILPNTRDS